jgi:hypothetical protein
MKTPVFVEDPSAQRILGFLEHEESFWSQRRTRATITWRLAPPKGAWPKLENFIPRDVRYNRRDEAHLLPKVETVQFQWAILGAGRDDGIWFCDALTTAATSDELNRCRGFTWFAEEYGYRSDTADFPYGCSTDKK